MSEATKNSWADRLAFWSPLTSGGDDNAGDSSWCWATRGPGTWQSMLEFFEGMRFFNFHFCFVAKHSDLS